MDSFGNHDWRLPTYRVLQLEWDELLVLDFATSSQSGLLGDIPVREAAELWHELRLQVWRALIQLRNQSAKAGSTAEVRIDPVNQAPLLLTILPITHRWGVGEDCGYSLKLKLAALATELEVRYDHTPGAQQAQSPASDRTED